MVTTAGTANAADTPRTMTGAAGATYIFNLPDELTTVPAPGTLGQFATKTGSLEVVFSEIPSGSDTFATSSARSISACQDLIKTFGEDPAQIAHFGTTDVSFVDCGSMHFLLGNLNNGQLLNVSLFVTDASAEADAAAVIKDIEGQLTSGAYRKAGVAAPPAAN